MGSETGVVAAHKLDDVMKRRREVCAEFESQPVATTADATCAIKNGYSWNPNTSASDPTQRRQPTSDMQLQSLLSEWRGRCHVLESSPAPVIADALWNRAPAPLQEDQHRRTTATEHAMGLASEERQQGLDDRSPPPPSMPSRNYGIDGMERPELKWSSWFDALQAGLRCVIRHNVAQCCPFVRDSCLRWLDLRKALINLRRRILLQLDVGVAGALHRRHQLPRRACCSSCPGEMAPRPQASTGHKGYLL